MYCQGAGECSVRDLESVESGNESVESVWCWRVESQVIGIGEFRI